MFRIAGYLAAALMVFNIVGCSRHKEASPLGPQGPEGAVEVKVVGVFVTEDLLPYVVLSDMVEETALCIFVGFSEADAIYMGLEEIKPFRPMTHDLLKSILEALDTEVTEVIIDALEEDIFLAKILLESNGSSFEVDSRPSDAIALALRVPASIYVSDEVMEEAGVPFNSLEKGAAKKPFEPLKRAIRLQMESGGYSKSPVGQLP